MNDLENANRHLELSIKICNAVKKHKCLHDRHSARKNAPLECESAWQAVAKECNETIEYCKNRWKSLCKSFFQGLKRRGNRYYLHEHLEFLIENDRSKTKFKSQQDAELNDESNEQNYGEDISQHEDLLDAINVVDDDSAISDSETTISDELSGLKNGTNFTATNTSCGEGVFIIDEIGEEADEGDNRRRSSYRRSCKRGLDAQLISELGDDEEPEGKRMRKITPERRKSFMQTPEKDTNTTVQSNKKVVVRVDKIKINKQTNEIVGKRSNSGMEMEELSAKKSSEPRKPLIRFINQCREMKDSFTFTNFATKDSSTQYEEIFSPQNYDEIFIQTIKSQMQHMNGRQKMNFKRKIFQSFLEVFDDATDFPGSDEVLQLPPKTIPRVVNTTIGELRLMRELVALVQAAKNSAEILNANETVKTNPPAAQSKTPSSQCVDNRNKQKLSPISLSPTLDDDDLQLSVEDEDDISLPNSWDNIKEKPSGSTKTIEKPSESNVMGLPRRLLQKVVRVSGSSGSTIVARDGDKKRIYRIYPKSANANGNATITNRNNSNVGTFYVAPNKNSNDIPTVANKNSNITIRTLSKPNSNSNEMQLSVNNSNPTSSNNAANKQPAGQQTSLNNVQPVNRILSATTGYFKMISSPKQIPPVSGNQTLQTSVQTTSAGSVIPKVTAVPRNSMLPPNSSLPTKKPITVRSHINSPPVLQRRYSICGPATKAVNPSPLATASKNPTPTSSSISQIQISQPISLNSKAMNSSNTQTVTSSVLTKKEAESTTPSTNIKPLLATKAQNSHLTAGAANKTSSPQPEEIPILETAGTVAADNLDPLFVKTQQIKSEPVDD